MLGTYLFPTKNENHDSYLMFSLLLTQKKIVLTFPSSMKEGLVLASPLQFLGKYISRSLILSGIEDK